VLHFPHLQGGLLTCILNSHDLQVSVPQMAVITITCVPAAKDDENEDPLA
jgi:hypothetical protein